MRTVSAARAAAGVVFGLGLALAPRETAAETPAADDSTLTILSVDARTLPGMVDKKPEAPTPPWRTSFGSERRSEAQTAKPDTAVDADIVMLQGVSDIRALRQWFPAGQWRLVLSRQAFAGAREPVKPEAALSTPEPEAALAIPEPEAAQGVPVPITAVAVRLRRGLRVTGQQHLLDLADALGEGPAKPTPAGTAVRVLIEGRETWAVSVLLPDACARTDGPPCPGRAALERWHAAREAEGVRRVTGGRFGAGEPASGSCGGFGLRLDPPPPPPKAHYTAAAPSKALGCAAAVTVTK
jgi:hypothetical protein